MYVNICLQILRLFYASKHPARQPLNDVPENGLTTGLATTLLSFGSAPGKRPTYPNGSSAGNWSDVTEKPTKHLPKKVGMSNMSTKRPVTVLHEGVTRFHF